MKGKVYSRRCINKSCKQKFTPGRPSQVVCSPICGVEYAKYVNVKSWEREKRDRKEKLKSRTQWETELQAEINKTARLIDRGWGCISCKGTSTPQAGHLHGRKSNPAIRYNLHNLWTQDTHCNQHKSGNELKYLEGVRELFGKEYMEYVQFELVRLYPTLKLLIPEIQAKIKLVRIENKKLEKTDRKFTLDERIELRNYYNELFGMY